MAPPTRNPSGSTCVNKDRVGEFETEEMRICAGPAGRAFVGEENNEQDGRELGHIAPVPGASLARGMQRLGAFSLPPCPQDAHDVRENMRTRKVLWP